ncbi:CobW family GTP-binding protein [Xanthobacter agilis]|uniref:Uncharacterized protein n=1 Tax=Xanthobacter agilis TaxID=47492 RepID=A0ABU0LK73_XANAG|nr:hypothetical protein [Xanthobacter agilis]MDQ0507544.1 hypothetical protein [Xanthobacter agilis]
MTCRAREEDNHTPLDLLAPQIACADVVVLDKMSVRDGEKLAAVRGVVKSSIPMPASPVGGCAFGDPGHVRFDFEKTSIHRGCRE